MMETNENRQESFPVRVDFARILETIAARIYDNQFAFLRENVQNAIDAVRMQAQRESKKPDDAAYQIHIYVEDKECRISDNGIGMNRDELQLNFWTMGASGKNTPEARAAGCIGTFGIGGFANFGVCETVEVTSRSETCSIAHRTSLSSTEFNVDRFNLPKVAYEATNELQCRGTVVRGIGSKPFDVNGLSNYLRLFVLHVREAVFFNGTKISQEPFSIPTDKTPLGDEETRGPLTFRLFVDNDHTISAQLLEAIVEGRHVVCSGSIRLVHGSLDVYKRGFRICAVNVPSTIGATGWVDCDQVRPTAGRDTLDSASLTLVKQFIDVLEAAAKDHIVLDSELLGAHVRLIPDFVRHGQVEKLGQLEVDLVGGATITLATLRQQCNMEKRVFFTALSAQTPTTEVLSARGHYIVRLSGNRQRRGAEVEYLTRFCGGQELEGLIECLEPYSDLDTFERSVVSEIEFAIRRLFKPPEFKLVPGRLTLDTPIIWTGKKDKNATIVFVDPKHGEFQKLKPLGYSGLFWSMIEAFCREYLGETLKRQSMKFFGSGAIDLDGFSKANSELWELVLNDIVVSRVGAIDAPVRPGGGFTQVVSQSDIAQVTISASGVTESDTSDPNARTAAKLLRIVDATNQTGLQGYYLRIPESATAAFGDIIRTFPEFGVVWFANRVTWQGCDTNDATAFLFDITLDRFVGSDNLELAAHGAMELLPSQVQTHQGQIYFFVPPELQSRIVPQNASDIVKLQVRHELVDLQRAKAWTAKNQTVS